MTILFAAWNARALAEAAGALAFAADGWEEDTGKAFPQSRTLDELRADPDFKEQAVDAVVAAIPIDAQAEAAE